MNKQMNNAQFAKVTEITTAKVAGLIRNLDGGLLLPCPHSGTK